MDSEDRIILAFSRQQAMDWSLVLASQEIDTTILDLPETGGWHLRVPSAQYEKAVESIRLYRLENKRWRWNQDVTWGPLTFHQGALIWCAVLALMHAFAGKFPGLTRAGILDSAKVFSGEWWRVFTSVTLHGDIAHLMANLVFGSLVLALVMARYGAGTALLISFFAGAAGNFAGLAFRGNAYLGLGSSGMMMGALGLLGTHAFALRHQDGRTSRYVFSAVAAGVLMFTLFGVDPGSDVLAHAGGFIFGALSGTIITLAAPKRSGMGRNLFAMGIFLAAVCIPWLLAFFRL